MNRLREVELAFLPSRLPDRLRGVRPIEITDIYLSSPEDPLNKMRLRRTMGDYELTKKIVTDPSDVSVQDEYNVPLSYAEFELFSSLGGRALTKDRYTVDMAGIRTEFDIFKGPLKGFVLVEFEFPDERARDIFVTPDYCIADVTQEEFVAGVCLAGRSYEDIAPELERFDYQPLYL